MPTRTAEKPAPLTKVTYTLKFREGQMDDLQECAYDTGIPVPEQIRRAVKLWIAKQRRSR